MKDIVFLGDSLERIREFPGKARRHAGLELRRVQHGLEPVDWKPMKSIGPGVREIRVRESAGAFRILYVAAYAHAVYVLHAFQKKTQATARRDLDLAMLRLRLLQ
ncbi:MAG: type II toxin-antitoxin system RelE/ParE family toxin [Reyranella sp.]|nr:type II toxin-antitoxin system RelE/ParE family toxin [Reyranella sp.]MDP3163148.1 type II toxin-antitoxin system RelE/ParE family toxin [Reyranella sp.]